MAMTSDFTLADLERIILERARSGASDSWTAKLVAEGQRRAARKLGEEAVEAVIAAIEADDEGLVSESADLLYHLLVVLAVAGIPLERVMAELERRTGMSGLAEKAARTAG